MWASHIGVGGDSSLQRCDTQVIRCEILEDLHNDGSVENMGNKVIGQNSIQNEVQKQIKFGERLLISIVKPTICTNVHIVAVC